MVNFRRMKLGDLDSIYKDPEIRSIITTSPKEQKFSVVIEEDNSIKGGASGYVIENAAFMQNIVVKKQKDSAVYKDGLIRSMIHFLELDGMDFLFVGEENIIYEEIGFSKTQRDESFNSNFKKTIQNEIKNSNSVYWISLKEFFKKSDN
ncbi:MAG: hypothetical protein GX783_03170 [Clostridiales bacterium]|nr:hypothetical protein [Clostridiales bacterium]